jgi:hypothetical protein
MLQEARPRRTRCVVSDLQRDAGAGDDRYATDGDGPLQILKQLFVIHGRLARDPPKE